MAPTHVLAAIVFAMIGVTAGSARAEQYRAGEFFSLDLSQAVLSPKPLGPPAEFAPVPVQARTDARQVVAQPKADHQRMVRTSRVLSHAEKPRLPARARVVRRDSNPLDAQAMDRSIQKWPCRSGGICNWK